MTLFLIGFYICILAFLIAGVVIIKIQYQNLVSKNFFAVWNKIFFIIFTLCIVLTLGSIVGFYISNNPGAVATGNEIDVVHY